MDNATNYNARCEEMRVSSDFKARTGIVVEGETRPAECQHCAHLSPQAGKIDAQRFCLNVLSDYFDMPKTPIGSCVHHSYGARFERETTDI